MNVQVNGWVVLGFLIMMILAFGFSWVMMNMMAPAMAAQVGGNQKLIQEINKVFAEQNKALDSKFTTYDAKIETIQKMK